MAYSALAVAVCLGTACSTHMVTMTYAGSPKGGVGGTPGSIRVGSFRDDRGTDANWLGAIRGGRSVILFPEGSRSPRGGLGPFKRGAAYVAEASGAPIIPVVIECDPPALMKGQAWYALPDRKLTFSLTVGEPLHAGGLSPGKPPPRHRCPPHHRKVARPFSGETRS